MERLLFYQNDIKKTYGQNWDLLAQALSNLVFDYLNISVC